MQSLADLSLAFGDPMRDANGQEGKPQAPIAHAMLYHAFGLMEMFRVNEAGHVPDEAREGFMTSLYSTAWYHQIEPRDLLLTYLRDWLLPRMPDGRV